MQDIQEKLETIKREFNSILNRDPKIEEIILFFKENNSMHELNNFINLIKK